MLILLCFSAPMNTQPSVPLFPTCPHWKQGCESATHSQHTSLLPDTEAPTARGRSSSRLKGRAQPKWKLRLSADTGSSAGRDRNQIAGDTCTLMRLEVGTQCMHVANVYQWLPPRSTRPVESGQNREVESGCSHRYTPRPTEWLETIAAATGVHTTMAETTCVNTPWPQP